jgi:hypothetical protein
MRGSIVVHFVGTALFISSLVAETGSAQGRDRDEGETARPAPLFSDGRINLSGTAEELGLWLPRDRTELGRRSTLAPVETIPFRPWAKALYDDRQLHELEPHARCKASGVARRWQTPYGLEFVQLPDIHRIYLFDVGGPHTFHTIYMDGRTHPEDPEPSNYGHAIGWWDGDTLVVETTGFNEDFWLDRTGLPHTEDLRTLERFTRIDFDTIRYEVTIDDSNVYTRPWSGGFNFRWSSGVELFEYICQERNRAGELQLGYFDSVDRSSPIVP